jgi:hypothetical protein
MVEVDHADRRGSFRGSRPTRKGTSGDNAKQQGRRRSAAATEKGSSHGDILLASLVARRPKQSQMPAGRARRRSDCPAAVWSASRKSIPQGSNSPTSDKNAVPRVHRGLSVSSPKNSGSWRIDEEISFGDRIKRVDAASVPAKSR